MTTTKAPFPLRDRALRLSELAVRLEPRESSRVSAQAAALLMQAMTRTNDPGVLEALAAGLSAVFGNHQRCTRAGAIIATAGSLHDSQGLSGAIALLCAATEPFPRRLSDQDFVDLLKRPVCVGPARRAVLDQLEYQHQRTFVDPWEFVRFAEQQKLGLDYTSPAQRP
jgi:hypothetical protein